jgi:hypothetical protein
MRMFSFFFGTITTLATHTGYCTSLMILASRSFYTSASADLTLSPDIGRCLCSFGLTFGSVFKACSMTDRWTPVKSDLDHANTS